MGYETKMYLTTSLSMRVEKDNSIYFSPIAMVDLCKCGEGDFEKLRRSSAISQEEENEPRPYFYASDGNTKVLEDLYGYRLVLLDVKDVIKAIESDQEKWKYRRFTLALNLLKSALEDFPTDNLKVLTFGY